LIVDLDRHPLEFRELDVQFLLENATQYDFQSKKDQGDQYRDYA
jgi:hypothetical protein